MPELEPAFRVLLVDPGPPDTARREELSWRCRDGGVHLVAVSQPDAVPTWLRREACDAVLWRLVTLPEDGEALQSFRRGSPGVPLVALLETGALPLSEALALGADEALRAEQLTAAALGEAIAHARARADYRMRDLAMRATGELAADAGEHQRVLQALRTRERHAQSLLQLSRRFERAANHAEILAAAREAIAAVIGFRRVWLYQLSEDGEYLRLILEDEGDEPLEQQGEGRLLRVAGDPMLEEIVAGTDVVVVEDARTDPRTNKEIVQALGNRTIVNVPIVLAGRKLGTFGTGSFHGEGVRPLSNEEREFLAALGSHAAAVLDRVTAARAREQAEQALKVFRTLVDYSTDALEVIDPETGRFLDCNAQSYTELGYTRDTFLQLTVSDIDPLVTRESWPERMESLRRTRRMTLQGIHRRRDGSTFPVEINAGWVELDRPYVVSVARDVRDRQRLEEQVRQSQKMEAIGQLAAGVAHDFNNLLCVISGYADLLLMRLEEATPERMMLSEIRNAGEQAARLTRQLLAFSRQQVLAPTLLDLNEVVNDVRRMLRRLIGEDILLTTRLAPDLCPVKVDAGQIHQVIMNLAVNARDAMPDGGTLTLETRNVERPASSTGDEAPTRFVLLAISDTGAGMSPEVRDRIFEPFYTTKGMGRGTGLGLAVVHGIVKQSGGEIEVETREGAGSAFRIYLPAATAPLPAPVEARDRLPASGTETILLVEDDDLVRRFAAGALAPFGYTLLQAAHGQEALEMAATHPGPIHLLVTDVVMPGMNGRQLAETLQARDPSLRVLFLSGYTDDEVMQHGIREAEVAFLQKPVSPKALAAKVRELLDRSNR